MKSKYIEIYDFAKEDFKRYVEIVNNYNKMKKRKLFSELDLAGFLISAYMREVEKGEITDERGEIIGWPIISKDKLDRLGNPSLFPIPEEIFNVCNDYIIPKVNAQLEDSEDKLTMSLLISFSISFMADYMLDLGMFPVSDPDQKEIYKVPKPAHA